MAPTYRRHISPTEPPIDLDAQIERLEFTVGLIDVIRIADGRFVERWGGPDIHDLLRQLGATPTRDD